MATVAKTQSRRQSVLVCSLLVVSLLLSGEVGGEDCVQGILPAETVNLYGPSSWNTNLPSTARSSLYVFPSMNFSCDGTITNIRMRMNFVPGLPVGSNVRQEVAVYFLLFHDGLNSPTRRVSYILFNQTNSRQYDDPSRRGFTEIWQSLYPLSLHVTERAFIGLAVPDIESLNIYTKSVNLMPTSDRVEAQYYQLTANFSEFEGQMLEAARTADSSQFTTQMLALPLIDVSFSPDITSTTLSPSTTSSLSIPTSASVGIATTVPDVNAQGEMTLLIVLVVVIATVILVMVAVLATSITMATVCWRKKKRRAKLYKGKGGGEKCHGDDGDDVSGGTNLKITEDAIYYESVGVEPNHYDTPLSFPLPLPPPLPTPLSVENKAVICSDGGGYVVMQPSPAYDTIDDATSSGDYTYVQVA